MATKTNTNNDGPVDKTIDDLPEPIDDTLVSDDLGSEGNEPAPTEEATKRAPPPVEEDDERDRIAKRYRENRDREREEENAKTKGDGDESDDPDSGEDEGEEADSDEESPKKSQVAAAAPQSGQNNQAAEITLKIDGVEVKKTLAEVIALAQMGGAGDKRFEEGKKLLDEVKALRAEISPGNQRGDQGAAPEPKPQGSPRSAPASEHPPSIADQEALSRWAEAIQVGDKAEAASALAELSQTMLAQIESRMESKVSAQVSSAESYKNTEREFKGALAAFDEKYPEIARDENLVETAQSILKKNLKADMLAAGVPAANLAPYESSIGGLVGINALLRQQGYKIRDIGTVVDDVGRHMAETYHGIRPKAQSNGVPSQSSQRSVPQRTEVDTSKIQERIDRKRAAPQQPRPSGVRMATQQAARPKTKAELVAEMRQSRGFPTLK